MLSPGVLMLMLARGRPGDWRSMVYEGLRSGCQEIAARRDGKSSFQQ